MREKEPIICEVCCEVVADTEHDNVFYCFDCLVDDGVCLDFLLGG